MLAPDDVMFDYEVFGVREFQLLFSLNNVMSATSIGKTAWACM